MFKVISETNLIQNVPIVDVNGRDSIVCLAPRGTTIAKELTSALQYLIDNQQISVVEIQDNINQEITSSIGTDVGSFEESIEITEVSSEEVESENSEEKPKRNRRKKTDGGDS